MYRTFSGGIELREKTKENRKVNLSFSSEYEVKRESWGEQWTEILDHSPGSVRLERLNDGAPLLKDHDQTKQIGVIESATVGTDRVGRAVVRFGKSNLADDEFVDVVDGIRKNISVGYRINKMVLESTGEDGDVYRAVSWTPLEVSTVSIPADQTVGIGRTADNDRQFDTQIIYRKESNDMSDKKEDKKEKVETRENVEVKTDTPVDVDKIRKEEKNRARDILAIGEMQGFQKEAIEAINEGTSVPDFQKFVLDKIGERKKKTPEKPVIGLGNREVKQFNIMKLIRHLHKPDDNDLKEAAGFELECSEAVEKKIGAKARGAYIPYDVLITRPTISRAAVLEAARLLNRDINTTDDASLIATDHYAGSFIDVLRNKLVVKQAGARVLDGLVGNVSIPKKTGSSTAYWIAEGITTYPTESEATYGAVTLSPKTFGCYTEVTRQMLNQSSPAIDQLTKDDLAGTMAVELDRAALHGTGASNQPTGIAATNGIGSVVGGTNGAAPDWADIVNLETEVAVDNADIGALAYLTNTKVRGKLKQTLITATYGDRMVWVSGSKTPLNDYACHITNNASSTLTKGSASGVCSAIFFGNWGDLLIGMWGTLDIMVDPYTYSRSGGIIVRALQDIDIAVRHAESFAAMLDALTT